MKIRLNVIKVLNETNTKLNLQKFFFIIFLKKFVSLEQSGNWKNGEVLLLDLMAVNLPRHAHDHRVGEVGDAARTAAVFLLLHAVPVDRLPERFLFDEVEALAEDSFGTARRLVVIDLDVVCNGGEETSVSRKEFHLNFGSFQENFRFGWQLCSLFRSTLSFKCFQRLRVRCKFRFNDS